MKTDSNADTERVRIKLPKQGRTPIYHPDKMHCTPCIALFPGSPRARTKNRKETGEPGKIYHVRNVTGREDLIARGRIKP